MLAATLCTSLVALLADPGAEDVAKIQGEWRCASCVTQGELDKRILGARLRIEGKEGRLQLVGEPRTIKVRFDFPGGIAKPKRIVWKQHFLPGEIEVEIEFKGIYSIQDDILVFCLPKKNTGPQVTTFAETEESPQTLMVWERISKAK